MSIILDRDKTFIRFTDKLIDAKGQGGCWLWYGKHDRNGYPMFSIKSRWYQASRIAYELFKGPFNIALNICHICDNPGCVNPYHLFLGTQADNLKDMTDKGRRAFGDKVANRGESNPAAKLTAIQVEEIRQTYTNGGVSQAVIGKMYGVSQRMVSLIVRREKWNKS